MFLGDVNTPQDCSDATASNQTSGVALSVVPREGIESWAALAAAFTRGNRRSTSLRISVAAARSIPLCNTNSPRQYVVLPQTAGAPGGNRTPISGLEVHSSIH